MSPRARARWGPALVALVVSLAAYAPALGPDRRLAGRDLLTLFEPLHRRVAEAWREGRLIERDPTRGCGAPTVPDPLAQVLYPPALLRAALPFDAGFALWFALHSALGGAGAAHLARRLGASPRGACLAALGGALAGPVLSACRTPNLLAGAAWTPWALAAFVDLAAGWRPRAAALGALAVGMTVLAGGAPVLVLLAPGVGVLLLTVAWGRWPTFVGALVGGAARVGAVTALGAVLAGAHLVPFVLFLPETPRGAGVALAEAGRWSMHPLRLVEWVVPGLTPQTSGVWHRLLERSFAPFGDPLHASVHLGLPIVVLGALSLARGDRRARGLGLACALWLVIALGVYTPLFAPLRALPLFGDWRYPEKAVLLVAVVLPALAGVGLRAVAPRWRGPLVGVTAALLLLGPLVDTTVLFTLPRAAVDAPPAVVTEVRAAEARRSDADAAGRYLRLARPAGAGAGRAEHLAVLHEDLPGRYGVPAFLAYGPLVSKRLKPYLEEVALRDDAGQVVGFDLARMADDACVAHVLLPDRRLLHQAVPPRARLVEGRGTSRTVEHGAERIVVDVDLETPGRLYVAEAYFPGWRATLEPGGQALTIDGPARTAFLAVALPAGRHRVTLTYRTPGLGAGVALSVVGALAVLALARGRGMLG